MHCMRNVEVKQTSHKILEILYAQLKPNTTSNKRKLCWESGIKKLNLVSMYKML